MAATAEWWRSFFAGLWEQAQLALWTDEDNREAADLVERALRLPPGSRVLDVPCGDGRISLELAARGHHVTGVDLTEAFLAQAAKDAQARGLSARWERGDMREISFEAEFDAVVNFGGSFGYFDDEGNARAAQSMYLSLVPGGRLLIDAATPETIFPRLRDRWWFPAGPLLVLSENRYDHETGRNETDWTVVGPDGSRERRHSSVRLYTYRELADLLGGVGFIHVDGFDAADLTPFGVGASRLLLVATK